MAKGPGGIISGGFDPLNAPDAPTIDSVSAGVLTADVTFSAPADTGAGTVDSYVITAKQSDGTGVSATASAAGTTTVTLTAGGTTTFAAQAISNAFGPGAFSGFGNSTSVFSGQELYAWGFNTNGNLGVNDRTSRSSPTQVGSLTTWSQVSTDSGGTLAIKTDGTLWSWSNNNVGQAGDGTTISRSSPVQIGSETNWAKVVGSRGDCSLAIDTDGKLYAWGAGPNGELGTNDTIAKSSPVQVGALTNWSDISIGNDHCLAIKTDGTLWAWGGDTNGAVGDGTATKRSSPVQIGSDTDWLQASAGNDFSIGIKTDGTLYGWGRNDDGQHGDGTKTDSFTPGASAIAPAFAQISAGTEWALGITADGEMWSWGNNSSGRLGLNIDQTIDRSSPVQIGALTSWSQADAGSSHGAAIKTDGTAWSWGSNNTGQLGNNSPFSVNRSSPVQIGSETSWTSISAGTVTMGTFGTTS